MIETKFIPPSEFYDSPRIPSSHELEEFGTVPLRAVEAHSILVTQANKHISPLDRMTLQRISESDDPDHQIDFKKLRKQIAAELDIDNEGD